MRPPSAHDDLRALRIAEYNQPFVGWDFSYFNGRRVTIRAQHTWDYTGSVVAYLAGTAILLS